MYKINEIFTLQSLCTPLPLKSTFTDKNIGLKKYKMI